MDRLRFALGFLLAAMSALLGTTAGWGTTLRSPTAVLGTDLGVLDPITPLENMINQSGLDKPFTSGTTDFDTYFTTAPSPFAQANGDNNWQSNFSFNLPMMGFVDFDFGAVYSIDRLAIWNRSLENIKILTSPTSIASAVEVASVKLLNKQNFPFSYASEFVDLGGAHDVRFMRIQIDSTYKFTASDTFSYAIVGEVVASAAAADTALDGDYNDDDAVDAADYTVWRNNLGDPDETDINNNGDGGDVSGEDYNHWKNHFAEGMTTGAGAGARVPEPTNLTLVALTAVARVFRRRASGSAPL